MSEKPDEMTAEDIRAAFAMMDAHRKKQMDDLADAAINGLKIIPSPFMQTGDRVLMVSQAEYDALCDTLDRRMDQETQGPSHQ